MHKQPSWRELLGTLIEDAAERHRIATMLRVSPITLQRWARGESEPRIQNLRRLLLALPQYREYLVPLIEQEFPEFSMGFGEEASQQDISVIPSEFYMRVLHTGATIPKELRFWSLCDLILQQALEHLDPNRQGLAVILISCMRSSYGEQIRSLREVMGHGTPPWDHHLTQQAILQGAESLAGYAVTTSRFILEQDLQESADQITVYRGIRENSAAAAPILRHDEIAGCLLVVSTQTHFFDSMRCGLIQNYAELLAVAFDATDFYQSHRINLGIMPTAEAQRPTLSRFQQRLLEVISQAARNRQPINLALAEQLVWQQLEEELLQLS